MTVLFPASVGRQGNGDPSAMRIGGFHSAGLAGGGLEHDTK
jgi:hypothetical protein